MTLRAFEHITLNTGATRMSPRSEVSQIALDAIREALDGRRGLPGWRIEIRARRTSDAVYDLVHEKAGSVVRCYLCLAREASDDLWEIITATLPDEHVVLSRPKGAVWLADDVMLSSASHAQALMESGDLARMVAWAILEDRE